MQSLKRLRRILFNTLTAISLLLAIATAGAWVRSLFRWDEFFRYQTIVAKDGTEWINYQRFCSDRGTFWCMTERLSGQGYHLNTHFRYNVSPPSSSGSWLELAFPPAHFPKWEGWGQGTAILWFPFWELELLTLMVPAFWISLRLLKRKANPIGHCPTCGYDMRANPAKCSECGHEAAAHTMAGAGGDQQR